MHMYSTHIYQLKTNIPFYNYFNISGEGLFSTTILALLSIKFIYLKMLNKLKRTLNIKLPDVNCCKKYD